MTKLLICDDSILIRKILKDIVSEDSEIRVAAEARNGLECLEMIDKYRPDVLTLDIEMPKMNGLDTLKKLKDIPYAPKVIMISSLTTEGAIQTMQALELGAVDFLPKPENFFSMGQEEIKVEIIQKIKSAAAINQKSISNLYQGRASIQKKDYVIKATGKADKIGKDTSFKNLLLIGCSTGGPKTLQHLIPRFKLSDNLAIVIVQHMPAKFTKSLADRLNLDSSFYVKEAEEGEYIYKHWVYIAPGDYHLRLKEEQGKLVVRLDQSEKWLNLRPTVNNLFESAASIKNYNKIALILTGMGSDGTEGLKTLKPAGCKVIAQDEATSVVYGMPKSAIEANLVDDVVPLDKIKETVSKYMEV